MIWIEMSKDKVHGGGDWGFTKCLWSPRYKIVGDKKSSWAYWECVRSVREGDIILHLRGDKNPEFVGQSIAATDGFVTTLRPPYPGEHWNYAEEFYRVNLSEYIPFHPPIKLSDLFHKKERELRIYYGKNKEKLKQDKRLLFYVIQNAKLRRQNGAYLSEVDDELYEILFGIEQEISENEMIQSKVKSSEGMKILAFRKGQNEFSKNVIKNFNGRCCFPGCKICDKNFLIGSHIARWADYPEYRGEISNGLCLCLIHDKAFEIGLFTLDDDLNIVIHKERLSDFHEPVCELKEAEGMRIKDSIIPINTKYMKCHWRRIGYEPGVDREEAENMFYCQ